jgi:uncharacterized protein YcnI
MKYGAERAIRLFRMIGAVLAVAAPTLMSATPAWAHVTVSPETLPIGSSDIELTFRVPNERDNASTVGLQVFFPADLPLVTVDVLPVTGWKANVTSRILVEPVTTDIGTVSQVPSDITWTPTADGIAPGQCEGFVVALGRGPSRRGSAIFKTLQTYSSGAIVRRIHLTSVSDPNPDSPAPVLTITLAPSSGVALTPSTGSSATA